MRTTVTIDPDVLAAVQKLRGERSLGLSEALNELARAGLKAKRPAGRFNQRSHRMGIKIDVTNVAEALEQLEGPGYS